MHLCNITLRILLCCMPLIPFAQTASLEKIAAICASEISFEEKEIALNTALSDTVSIRSAVRADIYYTLSRWYWRKNKRAKGKEFAEKELRIRLALDDSIKLKKNLYNLGYMSCRIPMPDYAASISYFDTLIKLSNDSETRLGSVYREKGDIYDNLGDFQRALENYYNSERIFKNTKDFGRLLKTYINISATYANLKDSTYLDAFLINKEKLDALSQHIELSKIQQLKIWTNLGIMYSTTGNLDAMLKPFQKALEGASELENTELIFSIYNNIGVAYTKQKKFALARKYFDASKRFTEGIKLRESSLFDNLADWHLGQGQYALALENYQIAIGILTATTDSTNVKWLPTVETITISPYKKDILSYVIDKSNCWLSWYQESNSKDYLMEASKTIALADTIIDALYFESRDELSKLFWREKGATLYLNAVSVCYELNDFEKAFYYMEKNKGLLLLENISDVYAKQFAGIPTSLIEKEYALIGETKDLERNLAEAKAKGRSKSYNDSIKNQIFELKNRHSRLVASLETKFPMYYTFKNNIVLTTSNEISKSLRTNEYIVSYLLGKEIGFVMLISKDELKLVKIADIIGLSNEVNALRTLLVRPFESSKQILAYKQIATSIYQKVFPFKEFESMSKETILRIVPDGILLHIPFEALTVQVNTPIEEAYLLQNAQLYYHYSLSIDGQIALLEKPKEPAFASFISTNFKDNYLPTLPENGTQRKNFTRDAKEILFKGKKSTKQSFLKAFKSHDMIHLSTHGGVVNGTPWIGFYDEKLLLDELYVTKSQKEIVVLSACKTAVGTQKRGEGVYNLTRGFINAGAKTVVATLWDVNEKSNTQIMRHFFEALGNGEKKASALQEAKQNYLEFHKGTSQASPYYWSAIISTGNNESIVSKPFNWAYLILSLVLLGTVGFCFKRYGCTPSA